MGIKDERSKEAVMEERQGIKSPKIYYISDYHFDHELARKRSRSEWFATVEQMNEEMITRHNEKVGTEDIVYILGDIVVCEEARLKERLDATVGRLQGHLHLILGNHDYKYKELEVFRSYFETVEESAIIRDGRHFVQLYHYPILCWYKKHKGAYHVYGHLHNERNGVECQILKQEPKALNACVEITRYEPCTLEELVKRNQAWENEW